MKVTAPLPLTLVSTSVAATALDEWSLSTAYDAGDKVYYDPDDALVFHEFEALTTHTGQTPAVGGTSDWLDLGPANNRRMFDDRTSTLTEDEEEISVTVSPGVFFDQVALVRLEGCLTARIVVSRGTGPTYEEFYDQTFDVNAPTASIAWSEYFFDEISYERAALAVQVPGYYSNAEVSLTLTGPTGGTVGLGLLLVGRGRELGDTIETPAVGIEDYSTKETDTFGNTYLLEREYADRASVRIILDPSRVDLIRRTLAAYRATPALYDLNNTGADSTWDSLIIFGFYEDFSVDIGYPGKAFCSLTVQSLI